MAFFQKGCYKWQPNKSLGLDVVNLIIFISKNGEKKNLKSQIFSLEKKKLKRKNYPSWKISPQRKTLVAMEELHSLFCKCLGIGIYCNGANAIRVLKMNKNDIQICKHYRVFRFIIEYSSFRDFCP